MVNYIPIFMMVIIKTGFSFNYIIISNIKELWFVTLRYIVDGVSDFLKYIKEAPSNPGIPFK